MRFQRADLPGIAIAALAPAGMMLLVLAGFELWHLEDSPLLGILAATIAVGAGVLAAFTRFVRHRRAAVALLALLLLAAAGVLALQQLGRDDNAEATALKVLGVLSFIALNTIALFDMLDDGLLPLLDRRAARRDADRDASA